MKKKNVYYTYNSSTEEYERVAPTRSKRVWTIVKYTVGIGAFAVAVFFAFYFWNELRREKNIEIKQVIVETDNEEIRERIDQLDERLNSSISIVGNIADRDDNIYRAIMHIDPQSVAQRFAGMENSLRMPQKDSYSNEELIETVENKLGLLERQIYAQSKSFDELATILSEQKGRLAHIPSIQPIAEKDMTRMASGFGERIDPVYGTPRFHAGMDFASPIGTRVYATADGVVTDAGWNDGGYGNKVDISHGNSYTTRYGHLSEIKVAKGQQVKRGDLIGLVGSTGKSTGPHLHYEVRINDEPQNPVNYYYNDLTPREYENMVNRAATAGHVMD